MSNRLGILGAAEIARRRFMPALCDQSFFAFGGLAIASEEEWGTPDYHAAEKRQKAQDFLAALDAPLFASYEALVSSDNIDAVYIPLPPALHYYWAKRALENGKHVLLEKPLTINCAHSLDLIDVAQSKGLALHENFMFVYHRQLSAITAMVSCGELGELRLIRVDFGFPFRGATDFRYNRQLGGGALNDCGCYTLKLALELLGPTTRIDTACLVQPPGFEVDLFGSATLSNEAGLAAQVSFGMDNSYRCALDIWGSKAALHTNRIISAPVGFNPVVEITENGQTRQLEIEADDTFYKSLQVFAQCVQIEKVRKEQYGKLRAQAILMGQFTDKANLFQKEVG